MHNAAIECIHWAQLDDFAPFSTFFRSTECQLDEFIALFGSVATHIHGDFGSFFIKPKKNSVLKILKGGKGLSFAPDQTGGIVRLHIEEDTLFPRLLLDACLESEGRYDF